MLLLMKRDSVADRYKQNTFNVSTDKALFKVRNRLIILQIKKSYRLSIVDLKGRTKIKNLLCIGSKYFKSKFFC